jgi:hypothetical protein
MTYEGDKYTKEEQQMILRFPLQEDVKVAEIH